MIDSVIDTTRQCGTCKEFKTLTEFSNVSPNKRYKHNKNSVCKVCCSVKSSAYYKTAVGKEKNKLRSKKQRMLNREVINRTVRLSNYKKQGISITKLQYIELYEAQESRCAICNSHESEQKKKLSLDHCHTTLKVRGFLCDNCNTALGKFKDDVNLLTKAINYLDIHG